MLLVRQERQEPFAQRRPNNELVADTKQIGHREMKLTKLRTKLITLATNREADRGDTAVI